MKAGCLAATLLLAVLPIQSNAVNDGEAAADRLDLRVRPSTVKAPPLARAQNMAPRSAPLRLEPRKSLIEQGVEGSREALIACQKGAYPGATVSASAVKVASGESQPDHCYRF